MQTVTYEFNDGSTQAIPVSEELYKVIIELELQEEHNNRRETRRHISLDYLYKNGIDFSNDDDLFTLIIKREQTIKIKNAIKKLKPKQKILLYQFVFEQKSLRQIAKETNTTHQALSQQLATIFKKLKKFL